MNKQDFISLLETPDLLGKQHISSLRSVAADFPYFQTAHILLTKALYNEKHYEFEKQLKHVSVMSPDRAVLFRFIHSINAPVNQALPVEVAPVIVHSLPDPAIELVPTLTQETPVITEHDADLISATPEVSKESVAEDDLVATELRPSEQEAVTTEAIPVAEVETSAKIEKPDIAVTSNETHSFAEWLMLQQKLKIVQEPASVETLTEVTVLQQSNSKEEEQMITDKPQETPSIQEEIAQQVIRSNVNEFESILDKFIRENPRISRGKAEFYNPVNMAKQSVEENDEVVTETLANIYYKQGHYKKAIRVYEKLCLIYPHKMPYFASLIQKIKTENKD